MTARAFELEPEPTTGQVVAKVRRLLRETKLTERKIARRLGIAPYTVHEIAIGRRTRDPAFRIGFMRSGRRPAAADTPTEDGHSPWCLCGARRHITTDWLGAMVEYCPAGRGPGHRPTSWKDVADQFDTDEYHRPGGRKKT